MRANNNGSHRIRILIPDYTIFPISLDPFYIATYYIKLVKTALTYSICFDLEISPTTIQHRESPNRGRLEISAPLPPRQCHASRIVLIQNSRFTPHLAILGMTEPTKEPNLKMIHGSVENLEDRMSPAITGVVPNDSMKCGLNPLMTLIPAKLNLITRVETADTGIYVTNIIFSIFS